MKLIDKIKKNKLLYFLGVLIVGIFIVLIVRFTYAYLAANVNEARGDVSIDSDETDNLKFAVGDPLSIDATPTTLPENGENLVDTTTATATLLANTTNNTAEYPYWVYFTISNNTFIYSDGSTPEIILTVTDPEGNPVTNIEGLTYGTYNGVAGFDITMQNGTFAVAAGHTITSSSSTNATEQTWNFTLTYLNLPTDQSANFGNSMTTEVSLNKEALDVNEVTLIGENTEIYTKDYSITNLLGNNGDFESQTGWSSCNCDTSYVKYGSYACRLDGVVNMPEMTSSTSDTFPLDSTHIYYGRVETYLANDISSSISVGIYWPIAEPHFVESVPIPFGEWTVVSKINDRASFGNGNYPFRLDFNNNSVAGSVFYDGAMLIDLTATYGSNYPDQEYLNSHLVYFNGTASLKTINVINDATFKINNVNNYTNLSCTNGATGEVDENGNVIISNVITDTTCRLSA